jgi:DNA-binding MarR family transcriptional regulator
MDKSEIITSRDLLAKIAKSNINTLNGAAILFYVASCPTPPTINDVARDCGMPISTVSRLAFDLFNNDWLTYKDDPNDRRKQRLVAKNLHKLNGTPTGKPAVKKVTGAKTVSKKKS